MGVLPLFSWMLRVIWPALGPQAEEKYKDAEPAALEWRTAKKTRAQTRIIKPDVYDRYFLTIIVYNTQNHYFVTGIYWVGSKAGRLVAISWNPVACRKSLVNVWVSTLPVLVPL
jgi:hypothetical protein